MDDEIPPLLPADQMSPVHTQADLDRQWRALMGPLGFSRGALWLMFLGPDGRPHGRLTQIDLVPERPVQRLVDELLRTCAHIVAHDLPAGSRVAVLRSRPGIGPVDALDRAWAAAVVTAARSAGVPCEPVHVANDERVSVVAHDDLPREALG